MEPDLNTTVSLPSKLADVHVSIFLDLVLLVDEHSVRSLVEEALKGFFLALCQHQIVKLLHLENSLESNECDHAGRSRKNFSKNVWSPCLMLTKLNA